MPDLPGLLSDLLMINLKVTPYWHFITVILIVWTMIMDQSSISCKRENGLNKDRTQSADSFHDPTWYLLQLGIIGFCSMASEGAMFDWSGVYFKDIVKAPSSLVILGYTSFMIMMATGRFMADYVITKIGRKRLLQICGIMISTGLFYCGPVSLSDKLYNILYAGRVRCFQHCADCIQCGREAQQSAAGNSPGHCFERKLSWLFNGPATYRAYFPDCRSEIFICCNWHFWNRHISSCLPYKSIAGYKACCAGAGGRIRTLNSSLGNGYSQNNSLWTLVV